MKAILPSAVAQNADAAVVDFCLAQPRPRQPTKGVGQDSLDLPFVRDSDILAAAFRARPIKIGIAATPDDVVANARVTSWAKGLGLSVANDTAATIGSLTSPTTLIEAAGAITIMPEELARLPAPIAARAHD